MANKTEKVKKDSNRLRAETISESYTELIGTNLDYWLASNPNIKIEKIIPSNTLWTNRITILYRNR